MAVRWGRGGRVGMMVGMGMVVADGLGEVVEGGSEGVEGLGVGSEEEAGMAGGGRFVRFLCGRVGSTAFGVTRGFMTANCLLSCLRYIILLPVRGELQVSQRSRLQAAATDLLSVLSSNRNYHPPGGAGTGDST